MAGEKSKNGEKYIMKEKLSKKSFHKITHR